MKYWQHEETGSCCISCDEIVTLRRHIEITKDQYLKHEESMNKSSTVIRPKRTLSERMEALEREVKEHDRRLRELEKVPRLK